MPSACQRFSVVTPAALRLLLFLQVKAMQSNLPMTRWSANLEALNARFPALAALVMSPELREKVCSFKAKDRFPAYGLREDSQTYPLTNSIDPGSTINQQMNEIHSLLSDFSRPVLIVGLYPGAELIHIFNLREQAVGNHCAQPIWVCVDSLLTLCGFLQTYDARALLASDRVTFFWHEEMPQQVDWLRKHPEFSHIFTFFSLAPGTTLERIMAPLVELVQDRDAGVEFCREANQLYYQALNDTQLGDHIAGRSDRRPRLLVPSCSWSTVIQYSIRDTCRAFQQAGWDTLVVDGPAMVTSYHLIQSIYEFKPDLFLYIDHLRQELSDLVPDELLVVSWVQDAMPAINNPEAARIWNAAAEKRNRDLIVGYVTQLPEFGYLENRLYPLGMIVDPEQFKLRELSDAQRKRFECDVCFASNCGLPTDQLVKERLRGLFAEHGLSETQLMEFHDRLWTLYRSGETVTSYPQLVEVLQLNLDPLSETVQLLFWRLNDIIYRHVVIEWLDDYAQEHPDFRLHLYGRDWEQHPRFAKYACGILAHGEELSAAFQSARFCLHLNAGEGTHQRLDEIIASGEHLLIRLNEETESLYRECARDAKCADELALFIHAGHNRNPNGIAVPSELKTTGVMECFVSSVGRVFPSREKLWQTLQEGSLPRTDSRLKENTIVSALIHAANTLLSEQRTQTQVLDRLRDSQKTYSAAARVICASIFRRAGDLDEFDAALPENAEQLSDEFKFLYAIECCHAGLLRQAQEILSVSSHPDAVVFRVRLSLALGQVSGLSDAVPRLKLCREQDALLRSQISFCSHELPPSSLPIAAAEFDGCSGIGYWRAVFAREAGDCDAAIHILENLTLPPAPWVSEYGPVELILTRFVAGKPAVPSSSASAAADLMQRLIAGLDGSADQQLFEDLHPVLTEGIRFQLAGTYSMMSVTAAAVAYISGRTDNASRLLRRYFFRYPASHSMLFPLGLHGRFFQALLDRIELHGQGFRKFFEINGAMR